MTIVDTDVLFGITDPRDSLYRRTQATLSFFAQHNADFMLLPTTLGEFVSLSTIKLGRSETQAAVSEILRSGYLPVDLPATMVQDAAKIYFQQTSKEESLFDCYVMAAAKQYKADCIFSFDRGYIKNGFVIAEDFVARKKWL